MIALILLMLYGVSSDLIRIGVLYTDLTPSTLQSSITTSLEGTLKLLTSQNLQVSIFYQNLTATPFSLPFTFYSTQIIIDYSFSPQYSQYLSSLCSSLDILHIVSGRAINSISKEIPAYNSLYTYPSYQGEALALLDFIKTYPWKNLGLFYDQSPNNLQMAEFLKSMLPSYFTIKEELCFDSDYEINVGVVKDRLLSETKSSGAKVMIIMANPWLSSAILDAADHVGLGSSGFVWIVNNEGMQGLSDLLKGLNEQGHAEIIGVVKTGTLGLISFDSSCIAQEEFSRELSAATLAIQSFQTLGTFSGNEASKYMKNGATGSNLYCQITFDSQGLNVQKYYLMNLVDYSFLNIATWSIEGHFSAFNNIIWPGLENEAPNDNYLLLPITCLIPLATDPDAESLKNGLTLAISEINSNNYLGSMYKIKPMFSEEVSASLNLVNFAIKTFEKYKVIAYIGPKNSDLAEVYAAFMTSDYTPKPIISYGASASILSNSTAYSTFIRTIQQDDLQASAVAMFASHNYWKKIGLIYTTDTTGVSMYNVFLISSASLGIEITNSESSRGIDASVGEDGVLTDDAKESINRALKDITRNQLKVILFLGNKVVTAELMKQAAEKELYGADYVWVGSIWVDDEVFKYVDTFYSEHRDTIMKALNGSIGLAQLPTEGSFGEAFSSAYFNKYNQNYTTASMFAYDAVYLFANAMNRMSAYGKDFNDGQLLANTLRSMDSLGASGNLTFTSGSNDRSPYGYSIINIRNNKIIKAQRYYPQAIINIVNETNNFIIWPNGKTNPPSDTWPTVFDCPFPSQMSVISVNGVSVVISVGLFLFILTFILSYFSYKKWKQVKILKITQPITRTWKDSLVQAQIVIEFFQFIAIAPTFESLQIAIESASNVFMLDVLKVAQADKQRYWDLLILVCILCYFWFLLVLLILTNNEKLLEKIPFIHRIIGILNTSYLPFIGNTMFLPFLALLFDAITCDHTAQAVPYVLRDCYMTCWEGQHVPYVIITAIAIIVYEPTAAFIRPLWQQAKTGLNIKIKPFFILFKTCLQILLIALGKSLQSISPLANGIVYTILMLIFAIVTFRMKPFNYNRCNLWEFSSIIAIVYLSILATISYNAFPSNIGWFIALLAGWIVIACITIFIQRKFMPDLLISPGSRRVRQSIKDILGRHKVGVVNLKEHPENINGSNDPEMRFDVTGFVNVNDSSFRAQDILRNNADGSISIDNL